jgi:hypothetical protein
MMKDFPKLDNTKSTHCVKPTWPYIVDYPFDEPSGMMTKEVRDKLGLRRIEEEY